MSANEHCQACMALQHEVGQASSYTDMMAASERVRRHRVLIHLNKIDGGKIKDHGTPEWRGKAMPINEGEGAPGKIGNEHDEVARKLLDF